ncbi:hypothetical protein ACOMHN_053056 [Nucella lapillus]
MAHLTDVSPPTEAVRLQQANTSADVDGQDLGNGTLFIAESCVTWQKESDGQGLTILYPCINCHAISRDLSFFHHECLHLLVEQQEEAGQGDENREDDGGPTVLNIRFIPLDKDMLPPMYTAMAQCQALHPDPIVQIGDDGEFDDYVEDEEDENEFFYDGEEGGAHLSSTGQAQLARLDALLQIGEAGDGPSGDAAHENNTDQFQDAEME